jgi:hypothetical protein
MQCYTYQVIAADIAATLSIIATHPQKLGAALVLLTAIFIKLLRLMARILEVGDEG